MRAQAQFEARRRAKWGQSSHHGAWHAGQGAAVGASGYGGGRRDFLGYYAMLGLDVEAGAGVSEGDVKRAFRQAALRWHPDRQKVRQTWLLWQEKKNDRDRDDRCVREWRSGTCYMLDHNGIRPVKIM